MAEDREMVSFVEDAEILRQLDARAKLEATNRSALLRRAVRMLLFSLPAVPTFENNPKETGETPKQ